MEPISNGTVKEFIRTQSVYGTAALCGEQQGQVPLMIRAPLRP